jgi:16S rRNA (uracil1498-N3)-methyltransferase
VLRLRPGEIVVVADGAGGYRGCRVAAGTVARARRGRPAALLLDVETDVTTVARVEPEVTVGFSLAKGDRTDWAVAKLSELGVDRIVPLVCDRTTVRWSPQTAAHQHGRLRRIAREASMQARRLWLPEVLDLLPFSQVRGRLQPADGPGRIALADPAGAPPSLATPNVLVGPEGGFAPRELGIGFPGIGLGDTILRIETAAVVAGAILSGLRAGVVTSSGRGVTPTVTSNRLE